MNLRRSRAKRYGVVFAQCSLERLKPGDAQDNMDASGEICPKAGSEVTHRRRLLRTSLLAWWWKHTPDQLGCQSHRHRIDIASRVAAL
jgi:hypothetical protein